MHVCVLDLFPVPFNGNEKVVSAFSIIITKNKSIILLLGRYNFF